MHQKEALPLTKPSRNSDESLMNLTLSDFPPFLEFPLVSLSDRAIVIGSSWSAMECYGGSKLSERSIVQGDALSHGELFVDILCVRETYRRHRHTNRWSTTHPPTATAPTATTPCLLSGVRHRYPFTTALALREGKRLPARVSRAHILHRSLAF